MALIKKIDKAYNILSSYSGDNPYILILKRDVYVTKTINTLSDFQVDFIIDNENFSTKIINKIIKIADWYGERLQKKYELSFTPNKINIVSYLGKTDSTYVCFAQYKQKMEPSMLFIPINGVLTDFLCEDYNNFVIDFERYNRLSEAKQIGHRIKPQQETGIKFLVSRKQCILADQMGYGKTKESIVAAIEGNYDSILIICPASLKTNWKDELMWYISEKDITIIDGFNDKTKGELEIFLGYKEGKSGLNKAQLLEEAKSNGKWQHNRFVIVNYDILDEFYKIKSARSNPNIEQSPMYEYIKNRKSLIIIDEAHRLSNSSSNTYKLIKSLIRKGKPEGLFLLTGTPVTNDPQNLFSLLALLDSPVCNDWDFYMKRYCGAIDICKEKDKRDIITKGYLARHGKRTWYELNDDEKKELDREVKQKCKHITIAKDPQNLDELKERISHIYLRRVKEDLGILPQKYVKQRLYTLTKEQSDEYERLWEEYETAKLNEDPTKELNKELLEGGIYRRYISNLMIPYTEQFVDKILAHDEKCIIACCFDEELYTLKEYYGDKCVIYNGKMSIKQKDAAKDAFMNDPNIKVFIGNIDSAGVGLTLTAARFVVFNDFSYGDYLNKQMEDRVYRIGQTKDCYIYYQMFKGTEYERMYNITQRKNNISETLIKKESDK